MPRQPLMIQVTGDDPRHLRRGGYRGHVGEDFEVETRGRTSDLRLEQVADLEDLDGRDDAFSLIFSGPRGMGSRTQTFRHPVMGTFELHVSPIGPSGQRRQEYEAIVNRSRGVRRRLPRPTPRPR